MQIACRSRERSWLVRQLREIQSEIKKINVSYNTNNSLLKRLKDTDFWFILNPYTETLFTGLSVSRNIENNIENCENTLILSMSSTDSHIIYIDALRRFKYRNTLEYKLSYYNGYSREGVSNFNKNIREIIGQGNIDQNCICRFISVWSSKTRKFLSNQKTPEIGVESSDLDLENHCFKSVSYSTGKVILGKIMASQRTIANKPENFDFTLITKSNRDGKSLIYFLEMVFNNQFMKDQLNKKLPDLFFIPNRESR